MDDRGGAEAVEGQYSSGRSGLDGRRAGAAQAAI